MKNRFNYLATCIFVSSSILITPQVSLAKETTSSNFLTKIFSLKSSSQSDKTEIFKTDIDSLNIQNLDDFEFSIQDILRNYFDKKTVRQFLNNISNEDDNNLDANSLDQFDNLLPKTKTDKINGPALLRIAQKLGVDEKTIFEIKKKIIFQISKINNLELALTEKTLNVADTTPTDSKNALPKNGSSNLQWIAGTIGLGLVGGGGSGGGSSGGSSWPSNPIDYQTTEYNAQYGLGNINAANAYARGYTGSGVTVSVLDSPFDTDHPNLQNVFVTGYDASSGGTDVTCSGSCTSSHGTHVAGIIAANKNDSGMHGVAYNAKIKPITIFNSSGVDDTTTSQLVNAINAGGGSSYAAMNNSWGILQVAQINFGGAIGTKWARIPSTNSIASSIQTAFDNAASNTVIVFSNGNEGWNSSTGRVYYYNSSSDASNLTNSLGYSSVNVNTASTYGSLPSSKSSLQGKWLTVVALDSSNNIASYSNGCGSIAKAWCISAPGSSIYSTVDLDDSTESGSYGTKSGTSMAAPHVTAAIAILKQQFPNLTSTQLVSLLTSTATDLGDAGVDDVYGVGMLNLNAASTPSGMPYIVASNANKLQATTNNTYIKSSSAFGKNLENSGFQVGILDAYNRAYVWSPIQESPDNIQLNSSNFLDQFKKEKLSSAKIGTNSFLTYKTNEENLLENDELKFSYKEDDLTQSIRFLKNTKNYYLDNKIKTLLPKFTYIYSNFYYINQFSNELELTDEIKILSNFASSKTDQNNNIVEYSLGAKYISENFANYFSVGNIIEKDKFLGASFEGAYDLSDSTNSSYLSFNTVTSISQDMIFNTNYIKMISKNSFTNSSFANISDVKSDAMQIGFSFKNVFEKSDKINFNYKKPLAVVDGSLNQSTVKGYDPTGDYNSVNERYSLINNARQETISIGYNSNLEENFNFFSTLHFTENWNNEKENNNYGILAGIKIRF